MATPEAPQYIGRHPADPAAAPRRVRLARLLDEHDPTGGPAKALLFLVHPGPSLLVTALTVGAAAMARHAAPDASTALRLVLLMLPAQFAIGAANDLLDLSADRGAKPHKPLVRGAVSRRWAVLLVAGGVVLSLAAAGTFGPAVLLATCVGLGAGLAYDAGLKRGAMSWLPWWIAFTALPLCAYTAVGRFSRELWWSVPLAALLAVGLNCANALPDIEGDRRAGVVSLPVLLGPARARALAVGSLLACAAGTAALLLPLHQRGPWLPLAWVLVAMCCLLSVSWRRLAAAPFPLLAPAAAALALAWLAALPT
jgi:4-hydroxybenzoate polyprenyltransferase